MKYINFLNTLLFPYMILHYYISCYNLGPDFAASTQYLGEKKKTNKQTRGISQSRKTYNFTVSPEVQQNMRDSCWSLLSLKKHYQTRYKLLFLMNYNTASKASYNLRF